MVKSASEASSNYREGINRIGVDAYRRAAQTSSPSEAASILEDAKQERLDPDDMSRSYEESY
jgi:hypothetical protein